MCCDKCQLIVYCAYTNKFTQFSQLFIFRLRTTRAMWHVSPLLGLIRHTYWWGNKEYIIFDAHLVKVVNYFCSCSSLVGKNQDDNHQSIFIGPECSQEPIILHEMFHIAGFYHEMRRFDRDDHVTVDWENILPGISLLFKTLRETSR